MKKMLAQTNAYLRRSGYASEALKRNAIESCTFEGARGLQTTQPSASARPCSKARTKKPIETGQSSQ